MSNVHWVLMAPGEKMEPAIRRTLKRFDSSLKASEYIVLKCLEGVVPRKVTVKPKQSLGWAILWEWGVLSCVFKTKEGAETYAKGRLGFSEVVRLSR